MFLIRIYEHRKGQYFLQTLIIFITVFLATKSGLWIALPPYYTSPIWLGSGVAIGMALLFGIRHLFTIIIAIFFGYFIHDYHSVELFVSPLIIASIMCVVSSLIVVLKYYLIKYFTGGKLLLQNPVTILKFLIMMALFSIFSYFIVSLLIKITAFIPFDISRPVIIAFTGSELIGSLISIPFIVSFSKEYSEQYRSGKFIEYLFIVVIMIVVALIVFFMQELYNERLAYIIVPFIFWIAFRLSIRDTTSGLVAVAVLSTYIIIQETTKFTSTEFFHSVYFFQLYLLILTPIFLMINVYSKDFRKFASFYLPESEENKKIPVRQLLKKSSNLLNQTDILQLAVKHSPGTVVVTDTDGKILFTNPVFSRITGYEPHEVIGKNPSIFKSGYHTKEFYEELWRTIKSGQIWEGEFYNKKKDGSFYWEKAIIAPVFNESEITHFVCTKEDITATKRSEEALRESEERLRTFFENTNAMILLIDSETGQLVGANPAALDFYGYTLREIYKINFFDIVQEPLEKTLVKLQMLQTGKQLKFKMQHKLKNGKIKDVEVYPTPVITDKKKILYTIIQDITRRKKAVAALKESESKKLALLKLIPDLILVVDKKGFVRDVYTDNPAKLYISPTKMLDRKFEDLMPLKVKSRFNSIISEVFKTHQVRTINYSYKKNGVTVYEEARLIVSGDKELLIIIRNISEQKRNEQELKHASDEAKRANTAKSTFLASISHEIRTPINAIIGFSELIGREVQEPHLANYISSIKLNGKTLLSLFEDILDLTKIESGELTLKPDFVDFRTLLEEVKNVFVLKMQQKQLDFEIHVPEEFYNLLLLDELRIRQILLNLVGNAYKFTDKGSVKINCRTTKKTANEIGKYVDLSIEVSDTGIGIASGYQEQIFEPFKQQEQQDSRKYGGTGLGLAITKRLVESMEGTISLKSEVGKGSTFTVKIPNILVGSLVGPGTEKLNIIERVIFKDATILLADGVVTNRELLRSIITGERINILESTNGKQTIEIAKEFKPDLIILDINISDPDGFEVGRILKTNADLKGIPIIATKAIKLTKEEVNKTKYFDVCISKPISIKELIYSLKKYLPYSVIENERKIEREPEKVANTLTKRKKLQLRKEIKTLLTEYDEIVDSSSFDEIHSFAIRIKELSSSFHIAVLKLNADKVIKASENFDIEEISENMKALYKLLNMILDETTE